MGAQPARAGRYRARDGPSARSVRHHRDDPALRVGGRRHLSFRHSRRRQADHRPDEEALGRTVVQSGRAAQVLEHRSGRIDLYPDSAGFSGTFRNARAAPENLFAVRYFRGRHVRQHAAEGVFRHFGTERNPARPPVERPASNPAGRSVLFGGDRGDQPADRPFAAEAAGRVGRFGGDPEADIQGHDHGGSWPESCCPPTKC